MNPYVINEPPSSGYHSHRITARSGDGAYDAVEVVLRFDSRTGPAKALMLLARCALEICVHARKGAPNV